MRRSGTARYRVQLLFKWFILICVNFSNLIISSSEGGLLDYTVLYEPHPHSRRSKRTQLLLSIQLIPEISFRVTHHASHRSSIVSIEGKHFNTISRLHLLDNKNMFMHRRGYE